MNNASLPRESGDAGYRAFISYSHRDEVAATRLHRWLENYRMPRRLRGSVTTVGEVQNRLVPIFRDRLELPAATNLNDQVKQALFASDALLVLCSPDARASRWVNAEIRVYRELHPDRPIIAALLTGEPEESFPPALLEPDAQGRVREPVAADFRKQADGVKLGRLKIIAGLTGVALDQLIQRDAQRQMRRVIAVTVIALLIALMMALMLTYVANARREAEYQRHQAEGLIEFMLTDLRDRLKGVGRLDILRAVNERALDYYGEQTDLSRFSVESLERRARILHAMGEDDQRRGDAKAALAKFREAHRVTATLLKAAPDDADRIFAHAQSEFWIAYVDFVQGRATDALRGFNSYRTLALRLTQIDPANLGYQRELAYAEGNICTIMLAKPEKGTEIQACRTALETMQRVARASPQDSAVRADLANRHAWMADALVLLGRKEEALTQRMAQSVIIDALLREDPRNATYLEDWMLARYSTAKLLRSLGQYSRARALKAEADTTLDRLITSDPENNDWRIWKKKLNEPVTN